MTVIDLAAEKRRRQGFKVLEPDAIDLKVYDNLDGRACVRLMIQEEMPDGTTEPVTETLLLVPETLRAWARKMLAVADQIDAPAPRLALVEEAS